MSTTARTQQKLLLKMTAGIVNAQEGPQDAPRLAPNANCEKKDADTPDDAWRNVTMESVGVRGKLLERLVAEDLATLGKWTDWSGRGTFRLWKKGISNMDVTKVARLCDAFWSERLVKSVEPNEQS